MTRKCHQSNVDCFYTLILQCKGVAYVEATEATASILWIALDKSLNVDFIKVQNPPNFKNKNAFSLDHFLLKVGTIRSNLIVIDAIELAG
jgi:hypothetical protein